MRSWKLASLLGATLGLTGGCQVPAAFRDFTITRAKDSGSPNEEMPPMRLSNDPVAANKSRWAAGKSDAGSEFKVPPISTTAGTLSSESPATKTPSLKAPPLGKDAQTTETAVAQNDPTASDAESILGAFKEAPPEVQELAARQYAAAANLRHRRDPADATKPETPESPATTTTAAAGMGTPGTGTPVTGAASIGAASTGAAGTVAQASATVPANNDKPSSAKTNNVATAAGQPAAGQTNTNQPANPAGAIQQASHTNKTDAASTAATAFLSDTDSSEPAAQPSGTASPAMTVETALEKASVNELVQALNERIESGAKDAPEEQRVRAQLLQRLLQVANRDHAAALEPIKELSPNEQKFVKHQLEALVKLVDEQGTPSRTRRYSEILPTLREAVSELGAATGALSVSEPIFCTEVESYGSVTRFEKFSFKPGQQVILYCEIDNFVAEQSSKGYETHLQGSYEIFDGSGLKVAEQTLPEDKQICDHYRRDYFIAYRLYLANQLQPGAHRLRLTMKDHKGKLYGQSEVAFDIATP